MVEVRDSGWTNDAQLFQPRFPRLKILQDRYLPTGQKTDGTFMCPILPSYNTKTKGKNCYSYSPNNGFKTGRIQRSSIVGVGP